MGCVEMNLVTLMNSFMKLILEEKIEVYNEFSLQHELGIFLRNKLTNYKIQFERNTKFFNITKTIKHEMDIVIYNGSEKYAIELKYPQNGQYPEQMFSCIKDIKFMEELKEQGFKDTYCLTLVSDKNFYSGKKKDGIYSFFRGQKLIQGTIIKPTGKKNEEILINNCYKVTWIGNNNLKYYIIKL